jgi:hypothetical protein
VSMQGTEYFALYEQSGQDLGKYKLCIVLISTEHLRLDGAARKLVKAVLSYYSAARIGPRRELQHSIDNGIK